MHDDVDKVKQNPAILRIAFGVPWFDALINELVFDMVHDRFGVNIHFSGAHDKKIGHGRDLAEILNHDVFAFFFQDQFRDSKS